MDRARVAGRSGSGRRRRVRYVLAPAGQVPEPGGRHHPRSLCFLPVPGEAASAHPREADDTGANFSLFASSSWYLAIMVLGMGVKIVFLVVFGGTWRSVWDFGL